ncbi:hypothetical protein Hdeb2414_s0012g00378351 [Helianthus debilis subsp. tardiflorus]
MNCLNPLTLKSAYDRCRSTSMCIYVWVYEGNPGMLEIRERERERERERGDGNELVCNTQVINNFYHYSLPMIIRNDG